MRTTLRRTVLTIAAGLALAANLAVATPIADDSARDAVPVPDAKVLLQFYPTALASTPGGMVEDQAVWLAKVQGLMVGAPPFLQQSLLMSRTKGEFAANVALLQQMQETALSQREFQLQRQFQQRSHTINDDNQPGLVGSDGRMKLASAIERFHGEPVLTVAGCLIIEFPTVGSQRLRQLPRRSAIARDMQLQLSGVHSLQSRGIDLERDAKPRLVRRDGLR